MYCKLQRVEAASTAQGHDRAAKLLHMEDCVHRKRRSLFGQVAFEAIETLTFFDPTLEIVRVA